MRVGYMENVRIKSIWRFPSRCAMKLSLPHLQEEHLTNSFCSLARFFHYFFCSVSRSTWHNMSIQHEILNAVRTIRNSLIGNAIRFIILCVFVYDCRIAVELIINNYIKICGTMSSKDKIFKMSIIIKENYQKGNANTEKASSYSWDHDTFPQRSPTHPREHVFLLLILRFDIWLTIHTKNVIRLHMHTNEGCVPDFKHDTVVSIFSRRRHFG